MQTLGIDLRYSVRMLLKNPGFTFITVITLALGIGANTAIFSAVDAILLRSLPYRDAQRLVVPVSFNPARGSDMGSITYADYLDWKKENIFEHVAAIDNVITAADLTGGNGEPERVRLAIVSEDYFAVMGASPLLGRTFLPEDYSTPGQARALIISYSLWQRRYGGDPKITEQNIYLNGRPYLVAGVMPKDSLWPDEREIFVPLAVGPNPGPDLQRRDNKVFLGVARLKPETSLKQVNAVMEAWARRLELEHPVIRKGWSNRAIPLREYIVGRELRTSLLVLMAAVGFVLLIACVNVANLLLSRAAAREREIAIRLAIGSSRLRLIRQLLTESFLLALLGGIGGILLAVRGVDLLKRIAPSNTPRLEEIVISPGVLIFTLVISLVTAVVCGLIPAIQSSQIDLNRTLKESGRTAPGSAKSKFVRSALVVSEIALSLVLLIGAGLLMRSFMRVQQIDPGLKVDRLVTMELNARRLRYPDARVAAFYRDIIERVKAVPGVAGAAISSAQPLGGGGLYLGRRFLIEGEPEPPAGIDHSASWNVVSPDYFVTTGMRLIKGRDFDERDTAESNNVIIINETLARRMFPDEEPIGKRIRSWRDENRLREIVGVVQDVRYYGRDDELRGLVYVPHSQNSWRSMALSVRTHNDPNDVINSIRNQIASVDRELAIANIATMATYLDRSVAPRRMSMLLLGVFAGLAALLAAIGIYGVLSYFVAHRTHEIGIRIAMGAQAHDVLRLVIKQGMMLTLIGIAIGLIGAFALTQLMKTMLFGVSASDPTTVVVVTVTLVVVALLACFVPARRATKVDPMVALRYD